jgi:hypothetical protein
MTEDLGSFEDDFQEVALPRMGVKDLFVDTLIHPAAAMSRLAEQPGRRWIWPLGILILLSVITVFAQMSAVAGYQQALLQSQTSSQDPETQQRAMEFAGSGGIQMVTTVFGAIFAILGVIVGTAIIAALLHFVGTIFGGQQGFAQTFTVVSWARVPLIFSALMGLAQAFVGGYDPCPEGLAGLICPDQTLAGGDNTRSYIEPLLAQIEIWKLWSLALLVIGVRAVSRISRGKALAAVGVVLLLSILVGMGGVAASNAASGFGG